MSKRELDPYTLRFAAKGLIAEAEKNAAISDFAYAAGYGDAGHDLRRMAREAERKRKAKGKK